MSEAIEFDVALELCADRRRRIVLGVLAEQGRPLTTTDLVRSVVKHDYEEPPTEAPERVVKQVRCELHHVHVPKLAMADVVDHDEDRKRVAPTDRFDRLEPYVEAILDADPQLQTPLEL